LYAGLVVPDVPLEESEFLRTEAKKNGIELVCQANLKFSFYFVNLWISNVYILHYIVDYNDLMHLLL